MKLYWRMGWRNIWRSKRRSAITLGALALSVALLIFFIAMNASYLTQMEENVTGLTLGDIQIHHPLFLSDQNLFQVVDDADELLQELEQQGFAAAARCYGFGLLSSDRTGKSAGVRLQGVSLADEPNVTKLHRDLYLFRGRYLTGTTRSFLPQEEEPDRAGEEWDDPLADADPLADPLAGIGDELFAEADDGPEPLTVGEMVLGKKLAANLGVDPGDTVNVVTMAADGTMGNEIFDVVGVLKNFSEVEDRSLALITAGDYQRLFHLGEGQVHEIAIKLPRGTSLAEGKATVQAIAGDESGQRLTQTWREIVPAQAEMMEFSQSAIPIFSMIMYLGAGLLIMNAMLMMVFERIREFGVMKAVGFKPRQLLTLIYFETFWICVVAVVIGIAVGVPLTLWVGHVGIDLTRFAPDGFQISGTVLDPVMYTELSPDSLYVPIIGLFLISFLSVLYPAIKAAVIEPVKAIYHV